jgi:hypothetical protein
MKWGVGVGGIARRRIGGRVAVVVGVLEVRVEQEVTEHRRRVTAATPCITYNFCTVTTATSCFCTSQIAGLKLGCLVSTERAFRLPSRRKKGRRVRGGLNNR